MMAIFKSIFDRSTWLSALIATIIWGVFWVLAATIFFFVITHPVWLKLVYIGILAVIAWGLDEYIDYNLRKKV
jgi:uncharacterized membrane protein YjjB (DUF3815 family)